jgi:hypothetical protein
MRIAAIRADGFRNLNGRIPLSSPLAVLLGPDNAGKSKLVDACRIRSSTTVELRTVPALPGGQHYRQRAPTLLTTEVDLRGPAAPGSPQPVIGRLVPGRLSLLVGVVARAAGVLVGAA